MRKRYLSTLALAVLGHATGSAMAADLPVKAPAAPVPAFSWTGCYIGGHIGAVISDDQLTSIFGNTHSFSSTGFVGGGQIGCDYQFATGWIVGVEGQAAWTSQASRTGHSCVSPQTGHCARSVCEPVRPRGLARRRVGRVGEPRGRS